MAVAILSQNEIDDVTRYAKRVGFERRTLRDSDGDTSSAVFELHKQVGMETISIDVHYEVSTLKKRAFVHIYWGSGSGNVDCFNEFMNCAQYAKEIAKKLSRYCATDEFAEVVELKYDDTGNVFELDVPPRLEGELQVGYRLQSAVVTEVKRRFPEVQGEK